jgi:PAS domain S-box
LLAVEPTVAASLAATDPLHAGYVAGTATVIGGGESALAAVPGVFLVGHLVYGVFVCCVAAVVLGEELFYSAGVYRRRAALAAAAVSVPAVTTLTHLLDVPIAPQYDTTPVWFGLSSALFLVATQTYGLFDLSPVAHETVFEEVDDAIVVADDRGLVVDANPAAETAFGVDETAIGRPASTVLPDENAVETLLDGGEATLETDDGRHFEATHTAVTATGSTAETFVFRDVTDRERVERRFRTYVEQSNDVLIVLDSDGTVEYASSAVQRVFGVEPAELTGRSVFPLVHPDDRDLVARVFRSTVEPTTESATADTDEDRSVPGAEPEVGDLPRPDALTGDDTRETGSRERFRVTHDDGGWRTVEIVVAAGVDENTDRLLVNVRDVTERQRYEQRLRVLNRVLRHDLRNDANVVLGYADLLLKSDLEPSVRERAETVREKANRLVELGEQAREVDRTLHAERGESRPIQLHDTVDSVAWRARETYPEAQIDTVVDGPVVASGNELVDSALWHLVSNGVEHNDSAEPWVRITVERDDEWVRITVTDDGPGIPESERKVLEHGTETALEHGSGLGLWLVKWITDSVGGNVSFAEREPRGSVVTVRLAATVDSQTDGTAPTRTGADTGDESPERGGTSLRDEVSDTVERPETAGE